MSTVIEIVAEHLRANGFGGLVSVGGGCGCELGDLVPCTSDCSQCEPGYKHDDPRMKGEWAIWKQKETPTAEQWEGVEI